MEFSWMKNKILITGANGFIGSHLAYEGLEQGFDVYAGIRRTSRTDFLKMESIHLFEMDLASRESMERQFMKFIREEGGFDYVVHNAGITYAKTKTEFFEVNTGYSKNLADALLDSGMPLKKFILISSLAAYGPGNETTMAPVQVTDPHLPVSVYGKSKFEAEQYLQSILSFPLLIVNPTAVYGPRDRDFLQFVKLVKLGLEPYIGSDRQMISLIYVKDLAWSVIQLLTATSSGKSYLISDCADYTKEQLGEVVKTILEKQTIRIRFPRALLKPVINIVERIYSYFGTMPFLNSDKLNEISQANWLCDGRQLWRDLSSAPRYPLEKGMAETISWYRENKWL